MTMCKVIFEYKKYHYMNQCMLFDLIDTPMIFNRNNESIIRETKKYLIMKVSNHDIDNYFNDNIISRFKNSWFDYLKIMITFLEIIISYEWKYKVIKIWIDYFEIKFLDIIIFMKDKHVNPDKIKILLSMWRSENLSDIKSFIDLIHWFQEYYKNMIWNIINLNKLSIIESKFL